VFVEAVFYNRENVSSILSFGYRNSAIFLFAKNLEFVMTMIVITEFDFLIN